MAFISGNYSQIFFSLRRRCNYWRNKIAEWGKNNLGEDSLGIKFVSFPFQLKINQ